MAEKKVTITEDKTADEVAKAAKAEADAAAADAEMKAGEAAMVANQAEKKKVLEEVGGAIANLHPETLEAAEEEKSE